MGQIAQVRRAQGVLARGPGHRLDLDPAAWAVDAAHGVPQQHRIAPGRDKLEPPRRQLIVARRRRLATRAPGFGTRARTHVDLDGLGGGIEPGRVVDESGKVMAIVEQAGQ